ncbi:hypothetical protein B0H10DRAFT_548115 [Mycena sp. CBHHK59/15]|nr:hypothetical protein B0H10DRAFT_548115 [Mycena sp. CBHHK59/15]
MSGERPARRFIFFAPYSPCAEGKSLMPSLACQLADTVPALRPHIGHAVEKEKRIASKAIEQQFQHLLAVPFQRIPSCTPQPVIVIDGLDQSDKKKDQVRILKLILGASRKSFECRTSSEPGPFPARVVFFIRPEPDLVEEFEAHNDICNTTLELKLKDDTLPTFYQKGFAQIATRARARGRDMGDKPWPDATVIDELTKRARGAFIYATTILAFVGDRNCHPKQRLQEVIDRVPNATAPLDALYEQILQSFSHSPNFLNILNAAIPPLSLNPEDIDVLFGLWGGEARAQLEGLCSLLDVPPLRAIGLREGVNVHHTTFHAYLRDPERSNEFCIGTPEIYLKFAQRAVAILSGPQIFNRHCDHFPERVLVRVLDVVPRYCPTLLPLFWDTQFYRAFSLRTDMGLVPGPASDFLDWLQSAQIRGTPVAPDMISIVEEFLLIAYLEEQLWESRRIVTAIDRPIPPPDGVYTDILNRHPEILRYLRLIIAWRIILEMDSDSSLSRPSLAFEHINLTWIDLRPLCRLRNPLNIPDPLQLVPRQPDHFFFPGQSPVDFLADPQRAGALYMAPSVLVEQAALCMISYINRLLDDRHARAWWVLGCCWAEIITGCDPSQAVLHEVERLDVSPFCQHGDVEPMDHREDHDATDHGYDEILEWLTKFEPCPVDAIRRWENQKAAAQQCCKSLRISESEAEMAGGGHYEYDRYDKGEGMDLDEWHAPRS